MITSVLNPRKPRLPHVLAIVMMAAFVLANARGLDRVPQVNEDEAWIAAPGVQFFETGRFATRVFAGYFGSEQHYYDFMPLYSLVDGAAIKLFGQSLVTVRGVSLACAALTLLLTYLIALRLLSAWHGVVSVLILTTWAIAATGVKPYLSLSTGIPLADLGRIGRYDVLVPVLGLASLLALLPALEDSHTPRWRLALSGALAALATLTHYYGAVWIVVLSTLIVARRGLKAAGQLVPMATGFTVALLPWVWFVLRDLPMFLTQKQAQAARYGADLGAMPGEWTRYGLVWTAAVHGNAASLIWIASVMIGVALLVFTARRPDLHGPRTLALVLAIVVTFFTLLVRRRLFNYLGTVWPLLALTAAFALLYAWPVRARLGARALALLAVVVAMAQGVTAYAHLAEHARTASTYTALCDRIAMNLPRSATLLALQHWWLGVGPRVADYRSFIVPLTKMNPAESAHPITFEDAMTADPMNYVLIDPEMADVLRAAGDTARPKASPFAKQIRAFLEERAVVVDQFEDAAYGTFTLYRVKTPAVRPDFTAPPTTPAR